MRSSWIRNLRWLYQDNLKWGITSASSIIQSDKLIPWNLATYIYWDVRFDCVHSRIFAHKCVNLVWIRSYPLGYPGTSDRMPHLFTLLATYELQMVWRQERSITLYRDEKVLANFRRAFTTNYYIKEILYIVCERKLFNN